MYKKMALFVAILLMVVVWAGCINESNVTSLANQMEETYNSLSTYRTIVNYTTQSGYVEQYIKIVKRPDKLKHEFLTPERKEGDLKIISGNTQWNYDKSNNRAYETICSINIGEESLRTPDFLNMLLFLMDNADVEVLNDEMVEGKSTTVLEISLNVQTTLSKWKFWLDKETLFPIKYQVEDLDGAVRYSEIYISSEINADIPDSEFELPGETEIISTGTMKLPDTIEECEGIIGWNILFPTYLPEAYLLENYSWIYQVNDMVDTVGIMYPHPDSKKEPNYVYPNMTNGIYLHEAVEDIWGEEYGPKANVVKVDINGLEGEYWVKEWIEYDGTKTLYLSWNIDEYWLVLNANGYAETIEDFVDLDNLVMIAESIHI